MGSKEEEKKEKKGRADKAKLGSHTAIIQSLCINSCRPYKLENSATLHSCLAS